MTANWSLRRLEVVTDAQVDALADVLIDCVEGGASVSFMHPLTRDRAAAFWRRVATEVAAGERALLIAEDAKACAGRCNWCSICPRTSRTAPTWRRCWSIVAHDARDSGRR